ncbi:ATPase involved in chromosome partitioning [Clostridium sp. SY8519]|uniref:hypothetical protein n=1 Tax=Clostridium sp. (strain SY8519) TaxID=1042156 RepID=UPI0002172189|nr:hypothetical protein [Clostridium sp. SY8519]BAK47982.1 ATPase involved in chromosome partitioning [Clostridium sp. SY8519]
METKRALNTQTLREEAFEPNIHDAIVDFKAGMDAQFIEHVEEKHLGVSNKYLRERITKGEWDDDLKKSFSLVNRRQSTASLHLSCVE